MLFNVYQGFFAHVYTHLVPILGTQRSLKETDRLELELEVVVGHHVSSGNLTGPLEEKQMLRVNLL